MPEKQYLLCYWLEKGVFQSEVNGVPFMEFRVSQLLRKGSSAIEALIHDEERKGRNLGACRAELTAMQQLLRAGSRRTVVLTDEM